MFGVVNKEYVDMPEHDLAQFVGRILYGIFTLLIVIVLLNMFIAMITNSYQKIEVSYFDVLLNWSPLYYAVWNDALVIIWFFFILLFLLISPSLGWCGCGVEICSLQTVSELLQGGTHDACPIQHYSLTKSFLLPHKVG